MAPKLNGLVFWSPLPTDQYKYREDRVFVYTYGVLVKMSDTLKRHAHQGEWKDQLENMTF